MVGINMLYIPQTKCLLATIEFAKQLGNIEFQTNPMIIEWIPDWENHTKSSTKQIPTIDTTPMN
jgi:hypothetical protein